MLWHKREIDKSIKKKKWKTRRKKRHSGDIMTRYRYACWWKSDRTSQQTKAKRQTRNKEKQWGVDFLCEFSTTSCFFCGRGFFFVFPHPSALLLTVVPVVWQSRNPLYFLQVGLRLAGFFVCAPLVPCWLSSAFHTHPRAKTEINVFHFHHVMTGSLDWYLPPR